MQYITLGKTGLKVSRLGFGGIPIQRIDRDGTKALFDTLEEYGINYVDTARGYTVSEEYIGYAIAGRRDKFILATKSMSRTKEEMARDIEISLKNLGTDYIDLYQVHNATPEQLSAVEGEGGALEALFEAKAAGKIRHIGLTSHSVETFKLALTRDWVETFMFPYNIVETEVEPLIEECAKKSIAFIAMKPLAGGAIDDASLALRYISRNPALTVAIPGMYSSEEVRMNFDAMMSEGPLTNDENSKIKKIQCDLGSQFCRRCGYCAPCTVGISIPNVFLFDGYLVRYGLSDWAKSRYATLAKKASDCIECGACEGRCPYNLPIREMLRGVKERFGE